MSTILLVQPWNYHDEGIKSHNLYQSWHNGPLSLLQLATQLRKSGHKVSILDMRRDLIYFKGKIHNCILKLSKTIKEIQPDIIGVSFYSVHFLETKRIVLTIKKICRESKMAPLLIGGGIHCSIEPDDSLEKLGFTAVFLGEADIGFVEIANGHRLEKVNGVYFPGQKVKTTGQEIEDLDQLEFPDWGLCDYKFYAHPSYGRLKVQKTSSIDIMMGRGCYYSCNFCAYSALSKPRYHSTQYLIEQLKFMQSNYDINCVYFIDSSIGSRQKLLVDFCEKLIRTGLSKSIEWLANIRVNQINENLIKLMWKAGCRFLFYGFESGSQRILDRMNKKTTVEQNIKAAELHNKHRFPYNASIIFGYPGETESDIRKTFKLLKRTKPPSIGINCYVPLPGSSDYTELKKKGQIDIDDPQEWRRIGEVNPERIYADISELKYLELYEQAKTLANVVIPNEINELWQPLDRL